MCAVAQIFIAFRSCFIFEQMVKRKQIERGEHIFRANKYSRRLSGGRAAGLEFQRSKIPSPEESVNK